MDLREWILHHGVGWELQRRQEKLADGGLIAGLQLALFARGPTLADDPGSPACRMLHDHLVAVANLAIPPELQPVTYAPFDRAFHLEPDHQVPEIELLVDITRSDRSDAGPWRTELEAQLRRLGVRQRQRELPAAKRRAAGASPHSEVDRSVDRRLEPPAHSLATQDAPPLSDAA